MQKMRMLFALFIALPILNLSLELGYAKTNDFSGFQWELFEETTDFKSKTDEEKDKILKELDGSISDLNREIKIPKKKRIIDLMKKILEINEFMKYRLCNQEDKNCSNEKKMLMDNLLTAVQDNFGECSVTYKRITELTSDTHSNLIVLNLIIQSIVENKEYIDRSKKDIIINIINCLNEKIDDYMDKIKNENNKPHIVPYLKESQKEMLAKALLELNGLDEIEEDKNDSESNKLSSFAIKEDVYGEIIDILKEIKD